MAAGGDHQEDGEGLLQHAQPRPLPMGPTQQQAARYGPGAPAWRGCSVQCLQLQVLHPCFGGTAGKGNRTTGLSSCGIVQKLPAVMQVAFLLLCSDSETLNTK